MINQLLLARRALGLGAMLCFSLGAVSSAHAADDELSRFKTAEKLAKDHIAKFDTLDFDVFTNQKWDRLKESH